MLNTTAIARGSGDASLPLPPRLLEERKRSPGVRFAPPALPDAATERDLCRERDSLYAEFRPLVQRLIRQYGDDPELRQDLEGEIYCVFCHLLGVYDPVRGVPLKPYLVRQLTASVYTYARRHWRRERREVSLGGSLGVGEPPHAADPSAEWDSDLMMQRIRERLPEAMARLPLRQRQVVIWRYYEYRSFPEIAELLGVQLATTRSILRHGLNNLRRWVACEGLEYEEP